MLPEINLRLWRKQTIAFQSSATEILYGGAAGGGKSHLMRVAATIWCAQIAGLQVYIFRRVTKDLMKNHVEGPNGFRAMLQPWTRSGFAKIVDKEIRFWNGSKIYLCHCEHEKNMYDYDGAEIHVLMIDELTHFLETIYRFLRGRVRAVGLPKLPNGYEGCFPRIVCGTNPGNIGHLWVKKCFLDKAEPMEIWKTPDDEGGMMRQFIPALLEDNPAMTEQDPTYELKLMGLGSKALVEAKRYGNWDIIEGAYFDAWSESNKIKPFEIPAEWTRYRSFDWGSAKPFSVGWYAVSPGFSAPCGTYIPKDALIKYREWYGCHPDKADTGLKMEVEEVGDGIRSREGKDHVIYSVADPAIFAEDGGPSMASRFADRGVYFDRADNSRIAGWSQVGARLKGFDDGDGLRPMLYFFTTCRDSIRIIPAQQHDIKKPEDIDTTGEDHLADELRYSCMSNPWVMPTPEIDDYEPTDGYEESAFEDDADGWKTV
ncbi:MAG: terminase [Planctomycetes bacterium]|nr:terminase [Planctomycetota bacterium]